MGHASRQAPHEMQAKASSRVMALPYNAPSAFPIAARRTSATTFRGENGTSEAATTGQTLSHRPHSVQEKGGKQPSARKVRGPASPIPGGVSEAGARPSNTSSSWATSGMSSGEKVSPPAEDGQVHRCQKYMQVLEKGDVAQNEQDAVMPPHSCCQPAYGHNVAAETISKISTAKPSWRWAGERPCNAQWGRTRRASSPAAAAIAAAARLRCPPKRYGTPLPPHPTDTTMHPRTSPRTKPPAPCEALPPNVFGKKSAGPSRNGRRTEGADAPQAFPFRYGKREGCAMHAKGWPWRPPRRKTRTAKGKCLSSFKETMRNPYRADPPRPAKLHPTGGRKSFGCAGTKTSCPE